MRRVKMFGFRCLCLGLVAFLPLTMQAKEIKVSFDARKYKNTGDWQIFIADLCNTLKKAPNYENGDTFDLEVQNGDIFKLQPDTDYGHYLNKEESQQTEHTKILSKIRNIEVDTKEFSTSSLMKIFPWTEMLSLPNAERISGFSEKISLCIDKESYQVMKQIAKEDFCPKLKSIFAPKVFLLGNAAFFNFKNLEHFNDQKELVGNSKPIIVCTTLAEDYFKQNRAPEGTPISPVEVEEKPYFYRKGNNKGKLKVRYEYKADSGKIGACAFQRCSSLQYVSAHVNFIGSAPFAASELKSVYLLFSRPKDSNRIKSLSEEKEGEEKEEEEDDDDDLARISIGYDLFFNCFNLKECFMMSGSVKCRDLMNTFEGCFWNCFGLETVCMPNIGFWYYARPDDLLGNRRGLPEADDGVFINTFSLKELDLRGYGSYYGWIMSRGSIQTNHNFLVKEDERFKSSFYASFEGGVKPPDVNQYSERVRKLVATVCEPLKDIESRFHGYDNPGITAFNTRQYPFRLQVVIFDSKLLKSCFLDAEPAMDNMVEGGDIGDIPISYGNLYLHTLVDAGAFAGSPKKNLYEGVYTEASPAFQRFNDAYLKWFVYKENLPPEEEEIVPFGKEKEEKPQNKIIGRKTKRTNFYLHGG